MNPKQVPIRSARSALSDRTLNVVDEGEGQTILFIHGFPLDHTFWRLQFELANRFRIIVPDLAGFGESNRPDGQLSIDGFADDIADLLDALKVSDPVAFCGLSMGGYIGWQFWKRHRDRISHLIACDTRAANDSDEVARARSVAAQSVRRTGSDPVAEAMIEKLVCQHEQPQARGLTESVRQMIARTDPESIAQGHLAMSVRTDATPWLSEINIPTLFVVGEHDVITPPSEMQDNASAVPGSVYVEIKNAGHLAPLENPVAFNAALVEFLDAH